MSTTCCAITTTGTPCTRTYAYMIEVEQRTTTMYAKGTLPLSYVGAGFLLNTAPLCKQHTTIIMQGKPLSTTMTMNTTIKENTMPITDTTGMPFHPLYGDIGAVNPEYEAQVQDDIDRPCDEFHPFVHNQLMYIHSECTVCGFNLNLHPDADKYREPTQEEILAAENNRGVLCGKCRKNGVPHPYHETVMQVRICYKKVTFK